ncbi:ABC transporter permease [Bartonella sp. HY329]|uniref:ABC transporter permease n=1 Tax=unclassified Bartonella TaxID=2645622 RepID=UPI0021C9EC90|nr:MULTISPECIES: ABC transporter permease [unclassified Bartonella]UXM94884.1 ABC transporter permease [Bartonella sp. HY329]UXN09207.1 ABC transporter permease [Bartonella sp. HY328]
MRAWLRIKALIIKELLAILHDRKSRFVLLGPPLFQLFIFSTAATLDVRNVDLAVLNYDSGYHSAEVIERIRAAKPTIRQIQPVNSFAEIDRLIDEQKIAGAVIFNNDFSRRIDQRLPGQVQLILDGRKSNTTQIVYGYLNEIINGINQEIAIERRILQKLPETKPLYWFNQNLVFQWFLVPNLVASIALLIGVSVTALSIARERENGTFDQLLVSPLKAHEILIGKTIPPMIIGFFQLCLFVAVALIVFHVPMRGSLIALLITGIIFLLAVAGIGLFISAMARTQQQAILGAFMFLVPAMLLSGFATPLENMPEWLQNITYINPLRYYLIIVRGIFLKDIPIIEIIWQTWPMLVIAAITLSSASILFRRRLE